MTESGASTRGKLGELMKVFDKAYGKVHVPEGEHPLDLAIYLVLRENWDYRKAMRALHVLQSEYVDWNEVRVTTAGELRGALLPLGDRDLDVKIEKLRTLLINLYRERNCAHLNHLREMDGEDQRRFLESLSVLSSAQIQVLIQEVAEGDELQIPQQAIRVLARVGIIPRVQSPAAARKHFEKLVDREEILSFGAHLVHHGDEICLSRSPRCGECNIVKQCAFKRKVGVAD